MRLLLLLLVRFFVFLATDWCPINFERGSVQPLNDQISASLPRGLKHSSESFNAYPHAILKTLRGIVVLHAIVHAFQRHLPAPQLRRAAMA